VYAFATDEWNTYYDHHKTLIWWIRWFSESAYLLYHWFFNWRYVKSTFRLPVLQKGAEFHNHMLEEILIQREEPNVIFSSQKLEDHEREMAKLKRKQRNQEECSTRIEVAFLLIVAGSCYPFVYVSWIKVTNFLHVPMFLLLNGVMLYSVVKTRFVIKSMPNLLPNENLVLVHVLLFTVVTAMWIVNQVCLARNIRARNAYFTDPTDEHYMVWLLAGYDVLLPELAYETVNTLLNMFMLFMLHQFSIF